MKIFKTIIIFQLLLINAAIAEDCQYQFSGIVRILKKNGYHLVVNEKSKSEAKFKIAPDDIFKFSVYLDRYVLGKAMITKEGIVHHPVDLATAIPDPLQINPTQNLKKINDKCEN